MATWTAGCGTDVDPRQVGTYFGCSTSSDCLSGYVCACQLCQPVGAAPVGCNDVVDTTESHDGASDSAGGRADGGTAEVADSAVDTSGAPDTHGDAAGDDGDSGAPHDGADAADGAGPCSPRTWQGCQAGEGCYVGAGGATFCTAHGTSGEGAACDVKAAKPPCGRSGGGVPLICDIVEAKCLPLCHTETPKCPSGQTCYPIGANNRPWPDHAGVCAK